MKKKLAWAKIISPERRSTSPELEICRLSEISPESTPNFHPSKTTLAWVKTLERASYFAYEGLAHASFISLGRDLQSELFCKCRLSEILLLE